MRDLLKSIFLEFEVADRYESKRYRKLRNKCSPQMDSEHMRKLRKRDYLKQSALKTNNELDWLNYRNARNKVNMAVKAAKSNYFKKGSQEGCANVRETWKLGNSIIGRKTKTTLINGLFNGRQHILIIKEKAAQINPHLCTLG